MAGSAAKILDLLREEWLESGEMEECPRSKSGVPELEFYHHFN